MTHTPRWITAIKAERAAAERREADRLARLAASRAWAMQNAGYRYVAGRGWTKD